MPVIHKAITVVIREHNDDPSLVVIYLVDIQSEQVIDSIVSYPAKIGSRVEALYAKHAKDAIVPEWVEDY